MAIEAETLERAKASDTTVLSVRDLRTSFNTRNGWVDIVKGLTFDIAAEETLAVVGESGSGKSVTALSVMRLLDPDASRVSGSVKLAGRELLTLNNTQMRSVRGLQIGMIFQEAMTSLNPLQRVGDQIAEVLHIHGIASGQAALKEADRLLDRVRMPASASRLNDYPQSLSGGMRQRVMIAMALACRPKLLIADEPTTALDVTIQAQILQLIKQLQKDEGMGVLFITHDMGVVAEVADRMVVMYDGKAVETGLTEDVFRAAKEPYTRALIAAVPRLGEGSASGPQPFPVLDRKLGKVVQGAERPDTVRRDGPPVLKVRNLVKRFDLPGSLFRGPKGRVHAVENVSFDIRAGETLSLVGESGCGKSTTGRAIMRLTEPQDGEIRIDDTDIRALDKERLREMRRHIQMIFQDPFASLDPRLTIGDAIAEPYLTHRLGTRAEAQAMTTDLLQRVGLSPDMVGRYPSQFSGGQRQRICIARALALEPKIIVADESVSALDVSIKAQVINLMMDLQEQFGLAYLFISHDMAVVERISHQVAVMYLGEIVEMGPARSIFKDPQHPYTKRLMAAVPVPDPARRKQLRPIYNDEIKSPIRPIGYVVPERAYREVSAGHMVQVWGDDWRVAGQ
jgi:peptide/nickel transport system ATP-binding protein